MFIQNVSYEEIKNGMHFYPGDRAVLIQILDPGWVFPQPKFNFKDVFKFNFKDEDNAHIFGVITDEDAISLVQILQNALENRQHVVVHCHAGLCRSGAVAEVGIIMGFQDTEKLRIPNLLVKHKMMKVLGLTYEDALE